MVLKNLKIGDTFTDGGRKYKVTKIVPQGYESIAIDDVVESDPEEVIVEKPKYTKTDINRLSKEDLEKVCVELGIEPMETGTAMKKAIIDNLKL